MNASNLQVYETPATLSAAAAEMLSTAIHEAVQNRGRAALALAGGNTPRAIYQQLAQAPHKNRIAWHALHLFWGDERMVPPDHPDSNYRMVADAMLRHVEIPASNVHRLAGELPPPQAAEHYEVEMQQFFGAPHIEIDLALLGLGEDGHTASLFPETTALAERKRLAIAVFVPRLQSWRVTMTLPVLNAARHVIFVVSGKAKAEMVKKVVNLDAPDPRWPASMIRPENGKLTWLLDREAAALL